MRWKVFRARYPVDPSKAWIATPGGSMVYARRFATWREAQDFVAAKETAAKKQERDRVIAELERDLGGRP